MLSRHQIEIDNRNVFYWQRNPDAKNVILFVHGFKGNHKGLTQLSEVFQEYRTILLDLPGYGISDEMPVKHTIENYARFIHRFIKTLNINDYELVGHSYGGSIAIVYAGLFPQKINHLILIAPAIPQNSLSQTLAEFQLNISNKLPHSWRKAWLASPFIEAVSALAIVRAVSQNRKLELMAANIRNSKEQRPKVITQCLKSFLNTPFLKYAIKISTPTYIIAGEADFLAPL